MDNAEADYLPDKAAIGKSKQVMCCSNKVNNSNICKSVRPVCEVFAEI